MKRTRTTAAVVASTIRKILKKEYPQYKFQVTSSNYAGGDSVRVYGTDIYPTDAKAIKAICDKYQGGYFDGMNDIYEYTRKDHDTVKFAFFNNEMSDLMRESIKSFLADRYNNFNELPEFKQQEQVYRLFAASYGHSDSMIKEFWGKQTTAA